MEFYDVVVIGGGQAGLAMGYFLRQQGYHFLIVDAGPQVGHAWRVRWDSLMLFTPARYAGLPGLAFPPPQQTPRPTKDDAADYLARYARQFDLPLRLETRIIRLGTWAGGGYQLETSTGELILAAQVVVASGAYQKPFIPPAAQILSQDVFQIHTVAYKNPAQLPSGDVLVVGGGNSGAQIAEELARERRVTWARRTRWPYVPRFLLAEWAWWIVDKTYMGIRRDTALGCRLSRQDAVYGVNPWVLRYGYGVRMVGEVVAAQGQQVSLADGQTLPVANIIWATGFRPNYAAWIDLPIFGEDGWPHQQRGVSDLPGLYFLGLDWMHTQGSGLMGWVGRDAAYLAARIRLHSPSSI